MCGAARVGGNARDWGREYRVCTLGSGIRIAPSSSLCSCCILWRGCWNILMYSCMYIPCFMGVSFIRLGFIGRKQVLCIHWLFAAGICGSLLGSSIESIPTTRTAPVSELLSSFDHDSKAFLITQAVTVVTVEYVSFLTSKQGQNANWALT